MFCPSNLVIKSPVRHQRRQSSHLRLKIQSQSHLEMSYRLQPSLWISHGTRNGMAGVQPHRHALPKSLPGSAVLYSQQGLTHFASRLFDPGETHKPCRWRSGQLGVRKPDLARNTAGPTRSLQGFWDAVPLVGQPQAQGLHGRSCGPCPTNGHPRILPGGMQIRCVCGYGNMTVTKLMVQAGWPGPNIWNGVRG